MELLLLLPDGVEGIDDGERATARKRSRRTGRSRHATTSGEEEAGRGGGEKIGDNYGVCVRLIVTTSLAIVRHKVEHFIRELRSKYDSPDVAGRSRVYYFSWPDTTIQNQCGQVEAKPSSRKNTQK